MSTSDTSRYFDILMSVAREDGIVTDHEKLMIEKIITKINVYNELLEDALRDGIINADEKAKLFTFRTNTFMENMQFVNEDKIITKDEKQLLETLSKILEQLGNAENKHIQFD